MVGHLPYQLHQLTGRLVSFRLEINRDLEKKNVFGLLTTVGKCMILGLPDLGGTLSILNVMCERCCVLYYYYFLM